MPLLASTLFHYLFGVTMFVTAIFLILLVLVQRGRGGGLAGAFGGLGGQSAFGAKAGDLFTRITMIAATFWILLCMLAIRVLNAPSSKFGNVPASTSLSAPLSGAGGEEPAQEGEAPGETGGGASDQGAAQGAGGESPSGEGGEAPH